MKNTLLFLALIAILNINTAKADIFTSDGARTHRQLMRDMDQNDDGVLDMQEIRETVDSAFSRFDANGDGKIEKDEMFEAYGGRIDDFDLDGDGVISKSEMKEYRKDKKLK